MSVQNNPLPKRKRSSILPPSGPKSQYTKIFTWALQTVAVLQARSEGIFSACVSDFSWSLLEWVLVMAYGKLVSFIFSDMTMVHKVNSHFSAQIYLK